MMGGAAAGAGNPSVSGAPMMGNGAAGMMGAEPGYDYSQSSCSAPTPLPGATVTVMLGDMGMTQMMSGTAPLGTRMMLRSAPIAVPAGQISFVVSNMGWRTHEMVILPLAAGAAAGARVPGTEGKVDEAGSVGEVSQSCAEGAGDGIASGAVGWITLTLAPGHYELVCNLQNHYADGMYQAFDVT
ncbi:MAG: hypothetical protein ABJD68_04900 [Nakamurella sp.]